MRDAARYAFTAEQWDACVQEDDYFHANNTAHTVRVVYVHPSRPAGHAELQFACMVVCVCRRWQVEDPRPLRSRAFGRLEMTAFIKGNLNKTLVTNSSLGYTEYECVTHSSASRFLVMWTWSMLQQHRPNVCVWWCWPGRSKGRTKNCGRGIVTGSTAQAPWCTHTGNGLWIAACKSIAGA